MSADEAATFSAYDTSHQAAIGILVVGIALLIWAGRRFRLADPGDRLGKVLAVVTLALTVPLQILYFTPGYWDLQKTLPIQLCDLASFVAIYALWTHKRWAVGLVYYWGLTLTTQAIITPDLAAAFPDPVFLLYWGMHLIIVWAACLPRVGPRSHAQLAHLPRCGGRHRGVGRDDLRLQRRGRHQLRLPQRQAQRRKHP